ncbi:flavodoxin family protein [Candidatus Micrarchaeota archaeon]|nr:flavodoxin family protein [Candidatus Micrarchaeota archaeon]
MKGRVATELHLENNGMSQGMSNNNSNIEKKTAKEKIIAISATHRDESNTEAMLLQTIEELENKGYEVQLIKLRKLNFKSCDGCKDCDTNERCHIKDPLTPIYRALLEAKVWIIATPEYWWNVSGLCKTFVDRLNAYWKAREKYFEGKYFAVITCGGQPIERTGYAERYLELLFGKLYFQHIGSVRASADGPLEILKQTEKLQECRELGKRIINKLEEKQT